MKTNEVKVVVAAVALFSALSGASSAMAASSDRIDSRLSAIRGLALKCAVQPLEKRADGREVLGRIQSRCSELEIVAGAAQFTFPAGRLQIIVRDSAHSDDGDLNTVLLIDERGREVQLADDVPAFGDPIYAVLGQDAEKLPRVR